MIRQDVSKAREALLQNRYDAGLEAISRYANLPVKDGDLLFLRARLLHGKQEWAAAEEAWRRMLAFDPHNAEGIAFFAECLASLGRRSEGLAELQRALTVDPDNPVLLRQFLLIQMTEEGLAPMLATLRGVAQRLGTDKSFARTVDVVRYKALSLFGVDQIESLDPDNLLQIDDEAQAGSHSFKTMYQNIEPIGDNCEFGTVQRFHGVERLALLRWTTIDPPTLLRLLENRLDGFEDPAIYTLGLLHTDEHILVEEKYGTKTHTGVFRSDMSAEEFRDRATRRQGFLKRKLLEDAASGTKIFLYKSDLPLSGEMMDALENALQALGVRHTLFVVRTDNPDRAGTIEAVSPTRVVGHLYEMSSNPADWKRESMIAAWDRVVAAANQHFFGKLI